MYQIKFQNIPKEYQDQLNQIRDKDLLNIYSKFDFLYYPNTHFIQQSNEYTNIKNDDKINNIKLDLQNYLMNFKFITFHLTNIIVNEELVKIQNAKSIFNAVICVEKKCLLIEEISHKTIQRIFSNLAQKQISILDLSHIFNNNNSKNADDQCLKEEINNFCEYFQQEFYASKFIKDTMRPIAGYIIRRHFYPTRYFNDPSFFIFDSQNSSNESNILCELTNLLCSKEEDSKYVILPSIINKIKKVNSIEHKKQNFNDDEFILLRLIFSNNSYSFYLVIHIKSLYIFMMKKIIYPNKSNKFIDHEIDFCSNYSNLGMTRFYGFLKEHDKKIGFIYEFMCNGSLDSYFKSNSKISDIYKLITINRIFQVIDYLHSNSLIHRDLKPSNILLDHDFIPYVSDFETIRHPLCEPIPEDQMSYDFCSEKYASPEQYEGLNPSYPTDIYSFGMIIYFIFERKDMRAKKLTKKDTIKEISSSKIFNDLCLKCIKCKPNERVTRNEIKQILVKEFNSFKYLENYLLESKEKLKIEELSLFMYESIKIQFGDLKQMNKWVRILFNLQNLITSIFKKNNSSFYLQLGNLYFDGQEIEINYSKSKKYFELSAKDNNQIALLKLGDIFRNGLGVNQNYLEAKKYYELSAQQNNSTAFLNLGNMYLLGLGVKQDYIIAKEYYLLSSQQENSFAFLNLGYIYENGLGVQKDYLIAKEYYKILAQQNNAHALLNLGYLYFYGHGVEKSYSKAKKYFELSAQQNNSDAFSNLGTLYFNGYGVKKNYLKAKEYFELSAKLNNSDGLYNLGIFYGCGYECKIDYLRAKYYFELSAQQNNQHAIYNLGILYLKGYGVEKNYSKAKEYFELSAKQNNLHAIFNLGMLYEKGYGVEKNYIKAKEYYELSAKQNSQDGLYKLGKLYAKGKGVEQNYIKAIIYFELSAKKNDPRALFYLGEFYSNGEYFYVNIKKAIEYYEKCSKIHYYMVKDTNSENDFFYYQTYNKYCYRSSNNISLFYITILNDLEKATKYLMKSGFNEFPFGQNNLGLLYQFFLNQIEDAKYMYKKSAKNNFSLAEYNLGYIYEKEGKCEESIQCYINASKHENEPLVFQMKRHKDNILEISKKFIICFVDLKLVSFYLSQNDIKESKKYFIKFFSKLSLKSEDFSHFQNKSKKNHFIFLWILIVENPLFNIKNTIHQNLNTNKEMNTKFDEYINEKNMDKEETIYNADDLFDYAMSTKSLKNEFVDSINNIISYINQILYTPPYYILFGRINLLKSNEKTNKIIHKNQINIDKTFYEGFGIDLE